MPGNSALQIPGLWESYVMALDKVTERLERITSDFVMDEIIAQTPVPVS